MTKKKNRINTTDPRSPQLFSNEELGLPPVEYEYRGTRMVTDKNGKRVRQAVIVRTKDSFVRAAREVWGDQNDYSESVLTGMKEPITIRCRKHDHYYTVPMAQNHIAKPRPGFVPTGCPLCASELAGYETNRGPHHLRTPEERERDEQEKARRRAEREAKREQRKAENLEELRRQRAIERYCRKGPDLVLTAPNAKRQPLTAREFYRRVSGRYGSKLTFQRKRKLTMQTKITATCYRHGPLTHDVQWWLSGKGCEYCNGKFYPPDFERLAHAAQGDDYIYKGVENIKSASDSVMVHCGNPDHEWHEMRVWLCLQGSKCRECAGRHQTVEQRRAKFVEDFLRKHGEGHFLIHAEDYVNNDTPIRVRCLVHHYDYETSPDNLLRGAGGCPFCTASEGEAVILGWLDRHHVAHQWHYQIPNLDSTLPLQYIEADFLVTVNDSRQSIVIEYNGEQHYEDITHFYRGKSVRTFAVQQHRDRYLRQYCADHHLRLLEIPYWEFDHIDSILNSVLLNHEPIPTFEPPPDKK